MKLKRSNSFQFRNSFDFGVTLEDLCPDGLHPRIKVILNNAIRCIARADFKIEQIIRQSRHVMQENLKLRKTIVRYSYYEPQQFPPGAFIWIVRHFVGNLPLQLLPKCNSQVAFNWEQLAEQCRYFLIRYPKERRKNSHLDSLLAQELVLLPRHNLLMLNLLLRFFVILCKADSRHVDKNSAVALVRYFVPALFSRPFKPDCETKGSKTYFPLLFYLLIRWEVIRRYVKAPRLRYLMSKTELNTLPSSSGLDINSNIVESCKKLTNLNASTQVEFIIKKESKGTMVDSLEPLNSMIEINLDRLRNNFSKTVETQTSPTISSNDLEVARILGTSSRASSISNHNIENEAQNFSTGEVEFEEPILTLNCSIESDKKSWSKILSETNSRVQSYLFDDYGTPKIKPKLKSINFAAPVDSEVFERVSKLGWTYTPPKPVNFVNDSKKDKKILEEVEENLEVGRCISICRRSEDSKCSCQSSPSYFKGLKDTSNELVCAEDSQSALTACLGAKEKKHFLNFKILKRGLRRLGSACRNSSFEYGTVKYKPMVEEKYKKAKSL